MIRHPSENITAVFLDRDGTIIEDTHYPRDPELVVMVSNAIEGIRLLNEKGYPIFVVSNQSGVGRGIIKESEFKAVHVRVCKTLQEAKLEIEEFFYCFHKPEDDCACRKPRRGLVPNSFGGKPFNFQNSYVVGDRDADLGLADALGAHGVLVLTGKGKKTQRDLGDDGLASYGVFQDLYDFATSLPPL